MANPLAYPGPVLAITSFRRVPHPHYNNAPAKQMLAVTNGVQIWDLITNELYLEIPTEVASKVNFKRGIAISDEENFYGMAFGTNNILINLQTGKFLLLGSFNVNKVTYASDGTTIIPLTLDNFDPDISINYEASMTVATGSYPVWRIGNAPDIIAGVTPMSFNNARGLASTASAYSASKNRFEITPGSRQFETRYDFYNFHTIKQIWRPGDTTVEDITYPNMDTTYNDIVDIGGYNDLYGTFSFNRSDDKRTLLTMVLPHYFEYRVSVLSGEFGDVDNYEGVVMTPYGLPHHLLLSTSTSTYSSGEVGSLSLTAGLEHYGLLINANRFSYPKMFSTLLLQNYNTDTDGLPHGAGKNDYLITPDYDATNPRYDSPGVTEYWSVYGYLEDKKVYDISVVNAAFLPTTNETLWDELVGPKLKVPTQHATIDHEWEKLDAYILLSDGRIVKPGPRATRTNVLQLPKITGENLVVDWGDGSDPETITGELPVKSYDTPGEYTVTISEGTITDIESTGDVSSVDIKVSGIGSKLEINGWERAFKGYGSVEFLTTAPPNFSANTSLEETFAHTVLKGDLSSWRLLNVVSLDRTWYGTTIEATGMDTWSRDISSIRSARKAFVGSTYTENLGGWLPNARQDGDFTFHSVGANRVGSNPFPDTIVPMQIELFVFGKSVWQSGRNGNWPSSRKSQMTRPDGVLVGGHDYDDWETMMREYTFCVIGPNSQLTVNWGDGSPDETFTTGNGESRIIKHDYFDYFEQFDTENLVAKIRLIGDVTSIHFYSNNAYARISSTMVTVVKSSVDYWGTGLIIRDWSYTFDGSNYHIHGGKVHPDGDYVNYDAPSFRYATRAVAAFRDVAQFSNLDNGLSWDLSGLEDISSMFEQGRNILAAPDASKVTYGISASMLTNSDLSSLVRADRAFARGSKVWNYTTTPGSRGTASDVTPDTSIVADNLVSAIDAFSAEQLNFDLISPDKWSINLGLDTIDRLRMFSVDRHSQILSQYDLDSLYSGAPMNLRIDTRTLDINGVLGSPTPEAPLRTFQVNTGGYYPVRIDWGDGSIEDLTPQAVVEHVYDTAGEYDVKLYGTINVQGQHMFTPGAVIDVRQFGDVVFINPDGMFNGFNGDTISAPDAPDLSRATTLKYAFANTPRLTDYAMSNWDVSTITDAFSFMTNAKNNHPSVGQLTWTSLTNASHMFKDSEINVPFANNTFDEVTDGSYMFAGTPLNQSFVGNNTFPSLVDGDYMFSESMYNQPLEITSDHLEHIVGIFSGSNCRFNEELIVQSPVLYNVSYAFHNNQVFNSSLLGINWSSVNNMAYLLSGATIFNHASLGLLNTSNVYNFEHVLQGTNYNRPLTNWVVNDTYDVITAYGKLDSTIQVMTAGMFMDASYNSGIPTSWTVKLTEVEYASAFGGSPMENDSELRARLIE